MDETFYGNFQRPGKWTVGQAEIWHDTWREIWEELDEIESSAEPWTVTVLKSMKTLA